MTSRSYAQIETSLTGSKRMRKLAGPSHRWAYVCAHLSSFCTYTGLFSYPPEIWAHDAQMPPDELVSAIDDMVAVGLIDHDPEEDFIRICGWFHKRSGPDNPNRIDAIISDLSAMDDVCPLMFCRSASELAAASVKRSLRWPADGKGREQLYRNLKQFLSEVYQDHRDRFLTALDSELDNSPATVRSEIAALLPFLSFQTAEPLAKGSERVPPTLAKHKTKQDIDQTETKKNENQTAHFPAENVSPLMPRFLKGGADAAEGQTKPQGPHPATIEAARRMGAIS